VACDEESYLAAARRHLAWVLGHVAPETGWIDLAGFDQRQHQARIAFTHTIAHTLGVLPRYRGMNVAEWAALEGGPVGCTVHFIDAGIDTGPILLVRMLDVSAAKSVQEVRRVVNESTPWPRWCGRSSRERSRSRIGSTLTKGSSTSGCTTNCDGCLDTQLGNK
jgi:hypothetical protein